MSTSFQKVGECLYRNLSSNTYYALVKVRGKQIRSSLKTKNLAEARRKLVDFRRDLGRIDAKARKITIEALGDRYLETVQHQAKGTVGKKTAIVELIKAKWGPIQAKDLNKHQIEAWLSSFKFGSASYNKYLRVIRAMLELALDSRMIAASGAERIKEVPVSSRIGQTPSYEDFVAIVKSIREQPFSDTAEESADCVEFWGLAGLGKAEAGSLEWGDVNFAKSQIITFRHKTKKGFPIPIYPQLRPLLEKRFKMATAANGGKRPDSKTKVFSVVDPKKALESACERLELPAYSSRAFRRLFCTTAIERGIDIKVVSAWQGHRDGGALLLKTYSHVRPLHSEAMAKLMTNEKPSNVMPVEGAA